MRSRLTTTSRRPAAKTSSNLAELVEEKEFQPQPLDEQQREISEEEETLRSRKEIELKRKREEGEVQKRLKM
jgi:hypothetical protein